MMDWTDRHCRYLHRLLSRHALLYTEMVTTGALIHGDVPRHLDFDAAEHPVADPVGEVVGLTREADRRSRLDDLTGGDVADGDDAEALLRAGVDDAAEGRGDQGAWLVGHQRSSRSRSSVNVGYDTAAASMPRTVTPSRDASPAIAPSIAMR